MSEIYWITRCTSICTVAIILMVIGLIASCFIGIVYLIAKCDNDEDQAKISKKLLKWSFPIAVVSTLVVVFVPTTKEAMFIYGVGSTIDYLRSNETAKQLPDKCIKALDKWAESYIMDEKDKAEESVNEPKNDKTE